MWASLKTVLPRCHAAWWRFRGRCPWCGRRLRAPFAYYMAAYPNCSVCTDENQADGSVWQAYRLQAAGT